MLFTPTPEQPGYTIRTKAQRFSPDMFYVNWPFAGFLLSGAA